MKQIMKGSHNHMAPHGTPHGPVQTSTKHHQTAPHVFHMDFYNAPHGHLPITKFMQLKWPDLLLSNQLEFSNGTPLKLTPLWRKSCTNEMSSCTWNQNCQDNFISI